jgi:negative regulator of replication initiation
MKIEIDDEMFKFLQKHAVPLVDTPSSVLRRLLFEDQRFQEACEDIAGEIDSDDRTRTEEPRSAEPSNAPALETSEGQRKLIEGLRRIRVESSNGFRRD